MIPAAVEYTRPSTVDAAIEVLADEDAKVLAGGQSLIPLLRLRLSAPTVLVDLGALADLRGVRQDGDDLVIGAMTTYDAILRDPLVGRYAPLLAAATQTVGDRQVRHLGTIGGSLAHADPAGDLPAVSLALDATMEVTGASGTRSVPATEFFVDYLTTALAPGELLTAVRVPNNRVAQGWALVGVAALCRRDNGNIADIRVALANMAPTPVRATAVETALTGAQAHHTAIIPACDRAAEGTSPADDLSASAGYRRHLACVLTKRAITGCIAGYVDET
ncbi:MAG: xanthine dehydrogenase family protein subunit M [Actinobacteria bacterium]|nr:MAG: xanthine dehydrogenase family protein subunit M [Actinomycetota bacterium]